MMGWQDDEIYDEFKHGHYSRWSYIFLAMYYRILGLPFGSLYRC